MNVAHSLRGSVKMGSHMKDKFWVGVYVLLFILTRTAFEITIVLASSHFRIM